MTILPAKMDMIDRIIAGIYMGTLSFIKIIGGELLGPQVVNSINRVEYAAVTPADRKIRVTITAF